MRFLQQFVWLLSFGETEKEDDVVGARAEEEVREVLAGLQAYSVGEASLELLDGWFFRFAAREVVGEVVYVDDHDKGSFGQVGAEVAGALEQELDRAVMAAHQIVHEVPPEA